MSQNIQNYKKAQKNKKKQLTKRGSTKEGLQESILVDFWLILAPFWAPNGTRNVTKKGLIFEWKKGVGKNGPKTIPRSYAHHRGG